MIEEEPSEKILVRAIENGLLLVMLIPYLFVKLFLQKLCLRSPLLKYYGKKLDRFCVVIIPIRFATYISLRVSAILKFLACHKASIARRKRIEKKVL